ncbi:MULTISPECIES: hypothetical protein [unclassified Pseudoclavibacter]|uniref:hypothetical protein n=1 Tax=unclassified Pseudoclavibacter TaxID=2615177 RepID=UPI001BAB5CE5|nr:hypothetical protein [Pseudoclavibacter sp. Marseille-Q4354]MBS3178924.1 hypothetical protein [Pseudoclavibacter sp. Marseille-Q4354]
MPLELVMLSDVMPSQELQFGAAKGLHPNGQVAHFLDGAVLQYFDAEWCPLLTVYETAPVFDSVGARASIRGAPASLSLSLWTEMTVPAGELARGRELAERIAAATAGVIRERV